MFKKIFGNKDSDNESGIDSMYKAAKLFGFDPLEMVGKAIPKLEEQARLFEQKAGADLFLTIALDENKHHLVLSIFKFASDGGAECLRSYPVDNLSALIHQIQNDLNTISHEGNQVQDQHTIDNAGSIATTDTFTFRTDSEPDSAGSSATGTEPAAGSAD